MHSGVQDQPGQHVLKQYKWENRNGCAEGLGYSTARKKGKAVNVTEKVRGGWRAV